MKTKNSIPIFFILLALSFWNPLSFYLLYDRTPLMENWYIGIFFCTVFLLGLCAVFALRRGKVGPLGVNTLFSLAFGGLFLAMLVAFDALLPVLTASSRSGLIFDPLTKAHYKSTEFECTAVINSFGVRDREFSKEKGDKFRILCFGDSWTFGWGVENAETWPALLEGYLHANGHPDAQVINCGQGGKHTSVYKRQMIRTVPELKPDLVLVGVLQGDDLSQLYEHTEADSPDNSRFSMFRAAVTEAAKEFVRYAFKNLLRMFKREQPWEMDLSAEWKNSVEDQKRKFDPVHKARYDQLPDTVRLMFDSGNLNAGLLDQYICFPDRYLIANSPENPLNAHATSLMKSDFRQMRTTCEENGAKLVFVNMPFSVYVGHQVIRNASDSLNTFLETHNRIDSIYRAVATETGIPYIGMTDAFRALPSKTDYFYRFDGHPNKKGYDEIARQINQQLLLLPVWGKSKAR